MSAARKKWLAALLVVSLALNVFFAAFLVGRAMFDDHGRHHHHRGGSLSMRVELRALARSLSDEARDALREKMRSRRDEVRPVLEDIHAIRGEIVDLLAADALDEVALEAAFERLSRRLMEIQAPLQDTILEAARDMSPEERRQMAEMLRRMRERHQERDVERGSRR